MVVQACGRAENAVDDLRLHPVAVHVLGPELRCGRPRDALLAVLVEPGLRHHVDAMMLARLVLLARGPHAAPQPEVRAVPGGPVRPVRAVGHVGHAVPERGRGVRGEQIARDPRQVDVAIGGDPLVAHDAPLAR